MQATTQGSVGYGQGRTPTTEVVGPVVRVRTGTTVQLGVYFGARGKPSAFVWTDIETAVPAQEIIVRVAREGAWLWEGQSRIDVKTAFPRSKEVARLVRPFEDWQRFFEKYYDASRPQRFFWGRYHNEGLQLARRLQAALIDVAVVRYQRPIEDCRDHGAAEIEL